MALEPWSERIKDTRGPVPMNVYDYDSDVPLFNASPTVVRGVIENTPGHTWMDRPLGGLQEQVGKYPNSSWYEVLFQNAR